MRRMTIAAALLLTLAGCAVGPRYRRPDLEVPAAHRAAPVDSASAAVAAADSLASIADLAWFEVFEDTTLRALVREALAANHDLRIAAARVQQARASAGIAGSPLWPWVGLQGGATRQQLSKDLLELPDGQIRNVFEAGAAVSWEIDLFGRIRREKEAAVAEALAAEYDRRGVVQSLVAEVAATYFSLRELDARLEIARGTFETRRGTLELFTRRYRGGVASRLETSQAEADMQATAAAIPDLERQIAITENALSVLLGRNPGRIARPPLGERRMRDPSTIPAGLPSQLLERRPDVAAAEERLRASNARVGAAFAQYFPTIDLTGFLGAQSRELSNLTTADAAIWSVGGGLFQPVFQGGRIRNVNKAAKADWEASVEIYLLTAQRSFQEVADALVTVEKLRQVESELVKRVAALEEGARLSKMRYDGGLSSYLEVLDADRQLFDGANALAGARGNLARAYVQVYRALGGGWDADRPAAEPAATEPSR